MDTLLSGLERLPLAEVIRTDPWLYPIISSAHIAGFALLVGAALLFDLRLLGLSKYVTVSDASRQLLPWARAGFVVAVFAGILMFVADPRTLLANPAFRLKLVLIALAGINANLFHLTTARTVDRWEHTSTPLAAKTAAVVSISLWLSVIGSGRFIAFV